MRFLRVTWADLHPLESGASGPKSRPRHSNHVRNGLGLARQRKACVFLRVTWADLHPFECREGVRSVLSPPFIEGAGLGGLGGAWSGYQLQLVLPSAARTQEALPPLHVHRE